SNVGRERTWASSANVALESRSTPCASARSTARAGTPPGIRRRLTRTLVSTTQRRSLIVLEQFCELGLSQARSCGVLAHRIAEALELSLVESGEPLVFLHRHDHCDVAGVATDDHGFPGSGVDDAGQALL